MARQLILGIDLQKGFLTHAARADGYVERVCEYLKQQNRHDVILTKFINRRGNNFEKLIDYTALKPGDPHTKLIGDLEDQGFEVVEKGTYTAWVPEVIERASQHGAKQIIMFGLDSDACVMKTAFDVFEAGLEPIIIENLSFSSNGQEHHDMAIKFMKTLIGKNQII